MIRPPSLDENEQRKTMNQPRNHIGFVQALNLTIRSIMLMSHFHYSEDPGVM